MKSFWLCHTFLSVLVASLPGPAMAQNGEADSWKVKKCQLYQSAVDDALSILGSYGVRAEFLEQNQQFIDAGCIGPGNICARSKEEFELANLLTIMTMNEGMGSTFVPFNCP